MDHIVISNVEMPFEVLKNHDENFVSKPHSIVSKYIGFNLLNIVFASYGDHWRLLHKMYVIDTFTKVKFKNFELRWQDEVTRMVENIIEYNKKRKLVEMRPIFHQLFSNDICWMLFGKVHKKSNSFWEFFLMIFAIVF